MTTATEPNIYGLNAGDTIWIDDDEFTYQNSYGVTDHGFITGTVLQCGQFCDGIHQYGVDRQGRVEVDGALIGEIRNGKFNPYEKPII